MPYETRLANRVAPKRGLSSYLETYDETFATCEFAKERRARDLALCDALGRRVLCQLGEQISTRLARCHCGKRLARRSNLDRTSAQRPEIASLPLAMTIGWASFRGGVAVE
jgi:hypothetical protein